jgi:hypothetical protein
MEHAVVSEAISLQVAPPTVVEKLGYYPKWIIEKFDEHGVLMERIEEDGNLLLTAGVTCIWKRFAGQTATAFDGTAKIGVGDSSTAESAAQTDLQAATNKLFNTVTGAPVVSGNKITYIASFTSGQAEWNWKELALKNNTDGVVFNRKVNAAGWGDKSLTPGSTWTVTLELTLS